MSDKKRANEDASDGVAKKAKGDKQAFEKLFDQLKADILEELPKEIGEDAVKYIDRMVHYTTFGGKMNRGLTVPETMKLTLAAKGKEATEEQILQASVVGWCIEWLQACFLVLDDIMDQSPTRRGQPCWYKAERSEGVPEPKVDKMAINDGLILESCIYILIKKYLKAKNHPAYMPITELFQETAWQTELGQLLDMSTESPDTGKMDFSRFSIERYKLIVKYKTAFYSFYLPVAGGLILAGVDGEKELKQVKDILMMMGEYFQIQDDVLDCYGTVEVIGKVGTDIQDKKCSWLCVQALKKCTPEQLAIMNDNYGQWDDAKVAKIKDLYKELKLKEMFDEYEEESYKEQMELIKKLEGVPPSVLETFLAKIYKRKL